MWIERGKTPPVPQLERPPLTEQGYTDPHEDHDLEDLKRLAHGLVLGDTSIPLPRCGRRLLVGRASMLKAGSLPRSSSNSERQGPLVHMYHLNQMRLFKLEVKSCRYRGKPQNYLSYGYARESLIGSIEIAEMKGFASNYKKSRR